MASCHCRSSPGIKAAAILGGVKKLCPRSADCVAVTPGAAVRLVAGRFGIFDRGLGKLMAISASPPPGANPRLVALPVLFAHPPFSNENSPQLSGWPSYLKGSVLSLFGPPSSAAYQRHMSMPPGTPRIDTT